MGTTYSITDDNSQTFYHVATIFQLRRNCIFITLQHDKTKYTIALNPKARYQNKTYNKQTMPIIHRKQIKKMDRLSTNQHQTIK